MIPDLVVTSFPDLLVPEATVWATGFFKHWVPLGISYKSLPDEAILQDPDVRAFREREAKLKTCKDGDIHRDVLRWSWKIFALTMEPMPAEGWMIWIDGDVEFIKTPTKKFFDVVCPEDADVSYLGRPWAYASETGFVAYNMESEATRYVLTMMRNCYLTGLFRMLDEWGDAGVFDHCRQGRTLRENNLAAHLTGPDLHVWPSTVLAEFLTHHKGPRRKQLAYMDTAGKS